jgi:hypothetical protein
LPQATTVADLCDIATYFDTGLTVKTRYLPLQTELQTTCPDVASTLTIVQLDVPH